MAVVDAQEISVEKNVVFGRGGSRDLLCDIYRPAPGREKHTAIITIHGGAFRMGSKSMTRLARPLAARGYTCISSQYRLADEATWPAQIQDVKACIRWVRANAGNLGVEPGKLVMLGYSAGGHLALVAAGSQNRPEFEGEGGNPGVGTAVAACVAFYPPAESDRLPAGESHPVLGDNPTEAAYQSFAPISYVNPDFPPTILLHGSEDRSLPVDNSLKLYEALRAVKAPVELHILQGVTHIFDTHPEFAQASADWIDLFLDRHVVNPRVYPSTEPGSPRPSSGR